MNAQKSFQEIWSCMRHLHRCAWSRGLAESNRVWGHLWRFDHSPQESAESTVLWRLLNLMSGKGKKCPRCSTWGAWRWVQTVTSNVACDACHCAVSRIGHSLPAASVVEMVSDICTDAQFVLHLKTCQLVIINRGSRKVWVCSIGKI